MLAAFIRTARLAPPLCRRFASVSDGSFSKDLYKILGVPANADKLQIKSAYTSLVKKHHPDVNKSSNPETFKDINLAYSVLSNEDKKKDYDGYLEAKSRMGDSSNFSTASTSYQNARTYTNVSSASASGRRTGGTTPRPLTDPPATRSSSRRWSTRSACAAGTSSSTTSSSRPAARGKKMRGARSSKRS